MGNTDHDRNLFERIANGDEAAFRSVFHQYNKVLYHTILKIVKTEHEAQEIIQELFLRLWLRRTTLASIENPGAWLHTVASNLSLDALRKQARQYRSQPVASDDTPDPGPLPGTHVELKEVQALIAQAVERLPPSRREVFLLSRQQGLSRKEIAQQLGLSESTVKNQLTAALRFVQDYLRNSGGLYLPVVLLLFIR